MKEIFILSLLVMFHSSVIGAAEIDCLGYTYYCLSNDTFFPCIWDEARNSFFATSANSSCPGVTVCVAGKEVPCHNESTIVTTEEPTTVTTEEPTTVTTEEPTTVTTEEPTTVTTEEPTTVTTEEPTTVTTEESTTVKVSPDLGELGGYTCASTGIYPHPMNCRRYIVCALSATGLTYVNSQHQCDNDLVYHSASHECKLDATPCDNMNFKCVATGRFADPLNPSKYVWCLKMNGAFIVVKYSCPAGKIYDGNNACVEPTVINAMKTLNLRKRSLELQSNNEADEDASVYFRGKKYSNL